MIRVLFEYQRNVLFCITLHLLWYLILAAATLIDALGHSSK